MKKITFFVLLVLASISEIAQNISTIAGNGTGSNTGDGGSASASTIIPFELAFDPSGNLYIAGVSSYKVRKINASGIISTFAGNGTYGFSGDGGPATSAKLTDVSGVASDPSGNIYIADRSNMRIRKVNTSGIITTVAGTGAIGFSGDGGPATSAKLYDPTGVAVDSYGNLYIADSQNNRIRKVNTSGVISTVAGNGTAGFSGDGGSATSAQIYVGDLAVDANGNIYFADGATYRVRKVNTSGIISTVAGNGTWAYTGDGGQATSASISIPYAIAVDQWGTLYISDQRNNVIRTVNSSGIINTMVGTGTQSFSGDGGLATAATMHWPQGVAVDASGNLFISDGINYRIRKVDFNCPTNAGSNQTNYQDYCGNWTPGVTIGIPSMACMTYHWDPSTNLSNIYVAQPTCTYSTTLSSSTITYYLNVSGCGCPSYTATVQVTAVKNTCSGCCREMSIGDQNQSATNFALFPNPANNEAVVSLYNYAEYIRVIDLTGKIISESKDIKEEYFTLDVSKYAKGLYFVIAKIGDRIEKQKLIVE